MGRGLTADGAVTLGTVEEEEEEEEEEEVEMEGEEKEGRVPVSLAALHLDSN